MKIMKLFLTLVLLSSTWVAKAQEGDAADLVHFQPLGRFTVDASNIIYSNDGIYIAGVQTEVIYPDPVAETDATDSSDSDEMPVEAEPMYRYWLVLWDIRGGQIQWRVELPEQRQLETLQFSPDSSILLAKTVNPDTHEEIRFSFYNSATGALISATGNVSILDAPLIPGDMPQRLYADSTFSADGQYVIVDYWRRAETPKCAIWQIADAALLWSIDYSCGIARGPYIAFLQPHQDRFSSYQQLFVYEIATGTIIAESDDEVDDYKWLDSATILIHRPYGDAPIVWNTLFNARAVLELPVQLGVFWPIIAQDQVIYSDTQVVYFWDKTTGQLINTLESPGTGYVIEQADRLILLQTVSNWRELETEDRNRAFRALDLETGEELWATRWQHSELWANASGTHATAYDEEFNTIDVFDLRTGSQSGSIVSYTSRYYFSADWSWLIEIMGNTHVVWGVPETTSTFTDPPMAQLTSETEWYYEPNLDFDTGGSFPAGQYIWIAGRLADGSWLQLEMPAGQTYWVQQETVSLRVAIDSIVVVE